MWRKPCTNHLHCRAGGRPSMREGCPGPTSPVTTSPERRCCSPSPAGDIGDRDGGDSSHTHKSAVEEVRLRFWGPRPPTWCSQLEQGLRGVGKGMARTEQRKGLQNRGTSCDFTKDTADLVFSSCLRPSPLQADSGALPACGGGVRRAARWGRRVLPLQKPGTFRGTLHRAGEHHFPDPRAHRPSRSTRALIMRWERRFTGPDTWAPW